MKKYILIGATLLTGGLGFAGLKYLKQQPKEDTVEPPTIVKKVEVPKGTSGDRAEADLLAQLKSLKARWDAGGMKDEEYWREYRSVMSQYEYLLAKKQSEATSDGSLPDADPNVKEAQGYNDTLHESDRVISGILARAKEQLIATHKNLDQEEEGKADLTVPEMVAAVRGMRKAANLILKERIAFRKASEDMLRALDAAPASYERAALHYETRAGAETNYPKIAARYQQLGRVCRDYSAILVKERPEYEKGFAQLDSTFKELAAVERLLGDVEHFFRIEPTHEYNERRKDLLEKLSEFRRTFELLELTFDRYETTVKDRLKEGGK